MRSIIIAALIFTGSAPAFASMPPSQWDHPFKGKMEKHLVAYGKAARTCIKLNPSDEGGAQYGCQFWRGKTCVIVYSFDPTGKDPKMTSNVFRHEQAHCNGWPSNHPGALP